MTILLIVLAWLLCGFVGSYIGWRFIDKCKYNLEVLPLIVMSILGCATLFGAVVYLLCSKVPYQKFFTATVFKGKTK